ncbi:MAG: hypothetical protein JXA89_16930 [Anaerolineae bacterium]|nr:hypothetical protein [Anaerolineae bacterium]
MYRSKCIVGMMLGVFLIVAAGIWLSRPLAVVGAPPVQGQVTPRPTISLPGPTPVTTPVIRKVDVTLIVDKAEAYPGDLLVYEAQVANVTGQKATRIWLTCDLPEGVMIEDFSTTKGVIHQYGQRLSVELGDLHAAFESYFVKIKARIQDDVEPGTELIHHVNLTSDQAGGGERDAITAYDSEVKTLVLGEGVEPKPETETEPAEGKDESQALPVTGNRSVPPWAVLGFTVLIAGVALWGNRGRIHLIG